MPLLSPWLAARELEPLAAVESAIATSLACICFTAPASALAHARRGAVHWREVRGLAPGLVLGALVGAWLAPAIGGRWLALGFALFVSFAATRMVWPRPIEADAPRAARAPVAFLIGTVSSLVGAGGGFLLVPLLLGRGLPMHEAVGTSAALGFPIAVAGTAGHLAGPDLGPALIGSVHVPALVLLAAGSVLAAPYGARLAHALPRERLRRLFAVVLYVLAASMLGRALG